MSKNRKFGLIFLIIFGFGLTFGFVVFPKILKYLLSRRLQLTPGNESREMFTKFPFPLDFKVYLFNYTNPMEVMKQGAKAKLEEIGPYVFREWKEKFNVDDDDHDDTMSYNFKNTFIFDQNASFPLTGKEKIIMPHPFLSVAILAVKKTKSAMLGLVKHGLDIMFDQPDSMFLTAPAMDILFDGTSIDCGHSQFSVKAICAALENAERGTWRINDTHFGYSLFRNKNGTDAGRFQVLRGSRNIEDMGKIMKFNDEDEMDHYHDAKCNKFKGTDSTIFPPFLTKEDAIWGFSGEICHSMGAKYVNDTSYEGLSTSYFTIDFDDPINNPEEKCFCHNPQECPPSGTIDLLPCVEAPLIASKPHFYKADPSLLENVIGLRPNASEHEVFMFFDLLTGTPLSGAKRLQFNVDMEPVPEYPIMANVSRAISPLFWIEESINLNQTFVKQLKNLHAIIGINNKLRWILTLFSMAGILVCLFWEYNYNRSPIVSISPSIGSELQNRFKLSAKSSK